MAKTIYAYTTQTYGPEREANGLAPIYKIGETEKTPGERIAAQDGTSNLEPLLFIKSWEIPSQFSIRDGQVRDWLKMHTGAAEARQDKRREWLICPKGISSVDRAINALTKGVDREKDTVLREEQEEAIRKSLAWYNKHPSGRKASMLWNAKMRFGKTLASYHLMDRIGAKKTVVLTYKPSVAAGWRADLEAEVGLARYRFISAADLISNPEVVREQLAGSEPSVFFVSFQDLLGGPSAGSLDASEMSETEIKKELKKKFQAIGFFDINWELAIIDEAHFGASTTAAASLLADMKFKKTLYLSGTPFRLLQTDQFQPEQIFHWTYTDENRRKQRDKDLGGDVWKNSPYRWLPQLNLHTYDLGLSARQDIALFNEGVLSLNKLFSAEIRDDLDSDGNWGPTSKFTHEASVQEFLTTLYSPHSSGGLSPFRTQNASLQKEIRNSFWYMPSVAAVRAMKVCLNDNPFFKHYRIVVAADNNDGEGPDTLGVALAAVRQVTEQAPGSIGVRGTIILSCGKLNTGVTIPELGAVFVLRDTSSPEDYFQTAFRCQSPDPERRKEQCHVFDFSPQRALSVVCEYATKLAGRDMLMEDAADLATRARQILQALNVLLYEDNSFTGYPLAEHDVLQVMTARILRGAVVRAFSSDRLFNSGRLQKSNKSLRNILRQIGAAGAANSKIVMSLTDADIPRAAVESQAKRKTEQDKEALAAERNAAAAIKTLSSRLPRLMLLTPLAKGGAQDIVDVADDSLVNESLGINKDQWGKIVKAGLINMELLNAAIYRIQQMEKEAHPLLT